MIKLLAVFLPACSLIQYTGNSETVATVENKVSFNKNWQFVRGIDTTVTPGDPTALQREVDYNGKPLASGPKDVVFAYAHVVDENGELVHTAQHPVTLSVEGDAEIIGQDPIDVEAGIATVLLRAGDQPGTITLQASSEGLAGDELSVEVQ